MTRDTPPSPPGRGARRGRCSAFALALVLAFVLGLAGAVAAGAAEEPATLFQWTDSKGVYRYTPDFDRIPGYARHTVVTIQAGEGPPSKTPVYFEPDPRATVVTVPSQALAEGGGSASAYDERIRDLEARIAEHEEALKDLISSPGSDADTEVSDELREIAARLPRLQAELAALQRGRASTVGP
jgi:uncharacterized coiled-coil protein SlyX